jgi:hypothetical protein
MGLSLCPQIWWLDSYLSLEAFAKQIFDHPHPIVPTESCEMAVDREQYSPAQGILGMIRL